ncbi:hypothetical protein K474DRAFT_1674604 [Panus rudis PR-1116 ss-1]|nr:hypothetical protein K474DRAFT_1674604 [Panus rudis PR-1116 ss-1]
MPTRTVPSNTNELRWCAYEPPDETSGPRRRTGKHRDLAIERLQRWRYEQSLGRYAHTSFSSMAVLPDEIIRSLSWDATLTTVEDILNRFNEEAWPFAPRHAKDVLNVLKDADQEWESRTRSNHNKKRTRESVNVDDSNNDCRGNISHSSSPRTAHTTVSSPMRPPESGTMPLSPSRARTQVAVPCSRGSPSKHANSSPPAKCARYDENRSQLRPMPSLLTTMGLPSPDRSSPPSPIGSTPPPSPTKSIPTSPTKSIPPSPMQSPRRRRSKITIAMLINDHGS